MTETVVGAGDNGRLVAVSVGDSVRIELPENPTTGFRWQMEPSSLGDVSALRLQSVEYQMAVAAGVGGGGRRVFRFSAVARGHVGLRLELLREWEGQAARETFVITVDVR